MYAYACKRLGVGYIYGMNGNRRERRDERDAARTYSYAEVERALAKLYDAEDVQQTTFRARLVHFRKQGIPARHPGTGHALRYRPAEIFQLLVALQLSETNINPYLIADIVRRQWREKGKLFQLIDLAQRFPGDDFHVAIKPTFMSWTWNKRKVKHSATEISVEERAGPVEITDFKASDMPTVLEELKKGHWFCIFNLSARVRALHKELTGEEANGRP